MVLMVRERKSEMNAMGTCSLCVCVCLFCGSFTLECVFSLLTFVRLFTVTLKSLSVHFYLFFPPSFLSEPAAICRFSEGLCCNYTSVSSGIHTLSHTPLPISLLGFCVQHKSYSMNRTPSLQCCLAVEISPSESCIRTLLNTRSQGCAFVCMKNLNSLEYFHFQRDDLIEKQHRHSDFKDILC